MRGQWGKSTLERLNQRNKALGLCRPYEPVRLNNGDVGGYRVRSGLPVYFDTNEQRIWPDDESYKLRLSKIRAERLLRRVVPRKEWLRYMIRGYVLVRGSEGGLYKLTKRPIYGVEQWWPVKALMCAVPADNRDLPPADMIAAQYLSIKNDEAGFMLKAL